MKGRGRRREKGGDEWTFLAESLLSLPLRGIDAPVKGRITNDFD